MRATGKADPAAQGRPRGEGKRSPHQSYFEELIARDPDIPLFGLREALADADGLQKQSATSQSPTEC